MKFVIKLWKFQLNQAVKREQSAVHQDKKSIICEHFDFCVIIERNYFPYQIWINPILEVWKKRNKSKTDFVYSLKTFWYEFFCLFLINFDNNFIAFSWKFQRLTFKKKHFLEKEKTWFTLFHSLHRVHS